MTTTSVTSDSESMQESVEKDEELEKFITNWIGSEYEKNIKEKGREIFYHEDLYKAIAAFSAKRAREKTLAYVCEQIELMAKLRETMNGKGDPGITMLQLAKDHFEELKS